MREFSLQLRLRNNRLRERRLELGMTNTALCEAAGIDNGGYGRLENLIDSPISKKTNTWKPLVLKLADYFKVSPGELFPDSVFDVVSPVTEVQIDGEQLGILASQMPGLLIADESSEGLELQASINRALDTLTPRERDILERRFGLNGRESQTLQEIADEFGFNKERPRQIEVKALCKLRHPSRTRRLTDGE